MCTSVYLCAALLEVSKLDRQAEKQEKKKKKKKEEEAEMKVAEDN